MYKYKRFGSERVKEAKKLFEEENCEAYLQNDFSLMFAFDKSLLCYGAFDEEDNLIGFIRVVGDGQYIVLVQDLIVAKKYRKQGIAKNMFKYISDKYAEVRMFQVNTDLGNEAANQLYKGLGMKNLDEGSMVMVRH